jgi:phage portal protein BeeE
MLYPRESAAASSFERQAPTVYDPDTAMSAAAAFPWVYVAVNAVATDLASLPLVAYAEGGPQRRGRRALHTETVDDPAIERLRRPGGGYTGTLLRQQVAFDRELSGDAYLHIRRDGLFRIAPSRLRPLVDSRDVVAGYELRSADGSVIRRIPASEILHIRGPAWTPDISAARGIAPVQPLHRDLETLQSIDALARSQALRGRPDILFSSSQPLGPQQAKQIVEAYTRATSEHHGAIAMGDGLEATPLSLTSRDMEYEKRAENVRIATLAVFGVPPARAGLVSGSYSADRQQVRTYWESLIRRATLYDDSWTMLARPGHRIVHDFADVEVLQQGFTDRLLRVATWVGMGATPKDAASYEGFSDAPVGDLPMVDSFHSPRRPAAEVVEPERSLPGVVGEVLAACAGMWSQVETGEEVDRVREHEATMLTAALVGCGVPAHRAVPLALDEADVTATLMRSRLSDPPDHRAPVGDLAAFASARAERIAEEAHRAA